MPSNLKAKKLVAFIRDLRGFGVVDYIDGNYGHMGATIIDAVLQAGVNYNSVVRPRVKCVREAYPNCTTTSEFIRLIKREGCYKVFKWKGVKKLETVLTVAKFFKARNIETEAFRVNRKNVLVFKGLLRRGSPFH